MSSSNRTLLQSKLETYNPKSKEPNFWERNESTFVCAGIAFVFLLAFTLILVFVGDETIQRPTFEEEKRFRNLDMNSRVIGGDDDPMRTSNVFSRSATPQTPTYFGNQPLMEYMMDGKVKKTFVHTSIKIRNEKEEELAARNAKDILEEKYGTFRRSENREKELTQEDVIKNQGSAVVTTDQSILPRPSQKEILGFCYVVEPFPISWQIVPVPFNITVDFSKVSFLEQQFNKTQFLDFLQSGLNMVNGLDPIYSTNVSVTAKSVAPESFPLLIQFGSFPFANFPNTLAVTETIWECANVVNRKRSTCPENFYKMTAFYMVIQTDYFVFGDATVDDLVYDLPSVLNHELMHSIGSLADTYDYECQHDILFGSIMPGNTDKRQLTPSVILAKRSLGYIDSRSTVDTNFGSLISSTPEERKFNYVLVAIIVLLLFYY